MYSLPEKHIFLGVRFCPCYQILLPRRFDTVLVLLMVFETWFLPVGQSLSGAEDGPLRSTKTQVILDGHGGATLLIST